MLNPQDHVLASLTELYLQPTGEFEVSGFHEVDNAFASYISRVFDMARINQVTTENKAYNRFIESPPASRVVVGKFDSLVEFLQMLRRSRGRPKAPQVSTDELPVINVSRSFDVVYSTSDNKRDTRAGLKLDILHSTTTKEPYAALDRSQAALSFTVTAMAFEKETLSLMLNSLTMHFRFVIHQSYRVPIQLANSPVELDCTFTDARDLIWSDMSAPLATDRLFAASVTLKLNTDVVRALAVEPIKQRTQLVQSSLMGR